MVFYLWFPNKVPLSSNSYVVFSLEAVHKSVNKADLRLLILTRPVYKVGPLLTSGNFDFPPLTGKRAHPDQTICLNNIVFAEHLLPFWVSGISVCTRQRLPTWQPPVKTLGTGSLSFPGWTISYTLLQPISGEWRTCGVTPLGQDPWKLMPGFPWTSLHVPFSFADFVVYIFFAVINHNPGYNYVPRPVSPPSKLLNLAVVCGLKGASGTEANLQSRISSPSFICLC